MSASWSIARLWLRAGESGPLPIIDREDGPSGRTVCLIPGHLVWEAPDGSVVDLLDEDDIAHARLIAAAPRLRAALAALVAWSARTGHGDTRPWQDARALLDTLRHPHAGN